MYDLTSIGDIKLDVFIDLGKDAEVMCDINKKDCVMQIKYGEKIPVDSAVAMMAGSAPNVAIGVRRMGGSTTVVSVLGNDNTAILALEVLKSEGISTDYISISKGTKSSFAAVLNFKGESTILAVHEPHAYTLPENIKTDWTFISELGPKYKELFEDLALIAKGGAKVGINPGAIQLEELDDTLFDLIRSCSLLIVNLDEARMLCKCPTSDPKILARTLQELGPKTVIITDGKNGSYGTDDGRVFHAPAFPDGERVEATGAGDAFSTGVLSALIANEDLATAMMWGSVNASSVIKYVGPQEGLLTQQQINNLLKARPEYQVTTI